MTPRGFRSGVLAVSLLAGAGLFALVFTLASAPEGAGPPPPEVVAVAPPDADPAPPEAPTPAQPAPPRVADVKPPPAPAKSADDLAAKAVALALKPGLPPAPKAAAGRKALTDPGLDVPLPAARVAAPMAKPAPPKPTRDLTVRPKLPPETIPATVGGGLDLGSYPLTPRQVAPRRQVEAPLAPLALPPAPRAAAERVPVTDPTADLSALRTIFTPLLPVALSRMAARFDLPDPFEFVAHLRAAPPAPAAELAAQPEPVPPALPTKP